MAIADDLKTLIAASSTGCRTCDILLELDGDDEVAVRRALVDGVSADAIADILRKNGYPVGATTIRRHRRERHQENA